MTAEIRRILSTPRKTGIDSEALALELTEELRTSTPLTGPDAKKVPARLWPHQAEALYRAWEAGGLLCDLSVGQGKTLITFLIPTVLEMRSALIMMPRKALVIEKQEEAHLFRKYWKIRNLVLLPYTILSKDYDLSQLASIQPDCLILDEADKLGNPKAASTQKVAHYLRSEAGRTTKVFCLSASLWKKNPGSMAHLADWALGYNSPLPRRPQDVKLWDMAVTEICGLINWKAVEAARLSELPHSPDDNRWPQAAVGDWMRATRGVTSYVTTFDGPLSIETVKGKMDPESAEVLEYMTHKGLRPDGEEIRDQMALWRHAGELALGYWSQWDPWPPGSWYAARAEWNAARDQCMKDCDDLHSDGHVKDAIRSGRIEVAWASPALAAWEEENSQVNYTVKAKWVTKRPPAFEYAGNWLAKAPERSLIWLRHGPAAQELGRQLGVPVFADGQGEAGRPMVIHHKGPAIVTVDANREGKNLQHNWSRNLFLDIMASSHNWDQALGRTHRSLQEHPVNATLLLSCEQQEAALQNALAESRGSYKVTKILPKLLAAKARWNDQP